GLAGIALCAFVDRFQVEEHEAAASPPAAGEGDYRVDRRVAPDDVHQLAQLVLHGLEGSTLVGPDAAVELAGILAREESLRSGREQVDVQDDDEAEDQHHQQLAGKGPVERVFIAPQYLAEAFFGPAREPAR